MFHLDYMDVIMGNAHLLNVHFLKMKNAQVNIYSLLFIFMFIYAQ